MNRYDKLMARLAAGARVMIDGATGTEIDRRGVPKLENAWNGGGTLSHPEIVRGIHEDYIRLGAEIVISNTFAATRHALKDAGEEERFELYNARAVELAVEARARMQTPDVLVAGGISYWSWTGNNPSLEDLRDSVELQAATMAQAGADLLVLEMMVDLDRMCVTLDAARTSGLPVWVGLSCRPNAQGVMCLWNGATLQEVIRVLKEKEVPVINIMHTQVPFVNGCLDVLEDHWDGPVGVYAHVGTEIEGKWVFEGTISPEGYAAEARTWRDRNVQLIGGCCGIVPDHIRALRAVMSPPSH